MREFDLGDGVFGWRQADVGRDGSVTLASSRSPAQNVGAPDGARSRRGIKPCGKRLSVSWSPWAGVRGGGGLPGAVATAACSIVGTVYWGRAAWRSASARRRLNVAARQSKRWARRRAPRWLVPGETARRGCRRSRSGARECGERGRIVERERPSRGDEQLPRETVSQVPEPMTRVLRHWRM